MSIKKVTPKFPQKLTTVMPVWKTTLKYGITYPVLLLKSSSSQPPPSSSSSPSSSFFSHHSYSISYCNMLAPNPKPVSLDMNLNNYDFTLKPTTSCKNCSYTPTKNRPFWIKALLLTHLWDVTLTPSLPSVESRFPPSFKRGFVLSSTLTRGGGGWGSQGQDLGQVI